GGIAIDRAGVVVADRRRQFRLGVRVAIEAAGEAAIIGHAVGVPAPAGGRQRTASPGCSAQASPRMIKSSVPDGEPVLVQAILMPPLMKLTRPICEAVPAPLVARTALVRLRAQSWKRR